MTNDHGGHCVSCGGRHAPSPTCGPTIEEAGTIRLERQIPWRSRECHVCLRSTRFMDGLYRGCYNSDKPVHLLLADKVCRLNFLRTDVGKGSWIPQVHLDFERIDIDDHFRCGPNRLTSAELTIQEELRTILAGTDPAALTLDDACVRLEQEIARLRKVFEVK